MLIDLDLTPCARYPGEDRLPERIAFFGDTAFPMRPKRDAGDGWAGDEQCFQRVTAIGRVVGRVEADNAMRRRDGGIEVPRVRPQANLEIDAAFRCGGADVL